MSWASSLSSMLMICTGWSLVATTASASRSASNRVDEGWLRPAEMTANVVMR